MRKVNVLIIRVEKNSIIPLEELRSDLTKKWENRISSIKLKESQLKIFFKVPVSLYIIDKTLELIVNIKEMHWRYEKKIEEGTSILEVLVD